MKNFTLRLPEDMFLQIQKSAKKNFRSINNEMLYRLSQDYKFYQEINSRLKDDEAELLDWEEVRASLGLDEPQDPVLPKS